MNWKKVLVADVLIAFVVLTVWVVFARGTRIVQDLWTPTGMLVCVDLTIALTLAVVWMWRDARARGGNPLPYVVVTLLTGSAGPLLYLLLRPEAADARLPAPSPLRA